MAAAAPATVTARGAPWQLRRLAAADAAAYQALRMDGIVRSPRRFRVAPEDEAQLTLEAVATRLAGTFVVGGFDAAGLVGIGGLTRYEGAKLRHRALLWGMYVHERARGQGLADELVRVLLAEAGTQGIEQVVLTVVAENTRARRLYERWGFTLYGVEPRALHVDGEYLDEALMVCTVPPTHNPGG